jgi:hypothetical protein
MAMADRVYRWECRRESGFALSAGQRRAGLRARVATGG